MAKQFRYTCTCRQECIMVHVNNIISGSNYQSDFIYIYILVSSPIFWLHSFRNSCVWIGHATCTKSMHHPHHYTCTLYMYELHNVLLCMRVINEVIGKMYVCMYSLIVKASKERERLNCRVH